MRATLTLLLLCVGLLTVTVQARVVEVTGSAAVVDGDEAAARDAAIDDALREAALQGEARVDGRLQVNDGTVRQDSTRISTRATVSGTEVLDAWREGGLYHVRVRTHVGPAGCAGGQYRKRIAALVFPLQEPGQLHVGELSGIETALPREILRRLGASGDFLTVDATDQGLFENPALAPDHRFEAPPRPTIVELARRLDAQFILSGVLRDIGREYGSEGSWSWLGPLARDSRRFEFELFVHDGVTGALLLRHGYAGEASGDVELPANVPFASRRFFRSDFGEQVDALLQRATTAIGEALRCEPLVARVLAVGEEGIRIDAGQETGVTPASRFTALEPTGPRQITAGGRDLGREQRPTATLEVIRVDRRSALTRPAEAMSLLQIRAGDYLRSSY